MASQSRRRYMGPGKVEVQSSTTRSSSNPKGKTIEHGVILKVVSTNICGSDQHMVRGRTTAPKGLVLGHEITGEMIEKGKDVEFLEVGDLVTVPFNVACGRCRMCREQHTGVCLNVNGARRRRLRLRRHGRMDRRSGRVRDGPLRGLQPARVPGQGAGDGEDPRPHMLSDILPTGFHGAVSAGSASARRSTSPGAGPVGLAAAASARILGAAAVLIGDMNTERLAHAKTVGFEPIDLNKSDKLEELIEADPRRTRGRRRGGRGRLRGPRPRQEARHRGACDGAQLADGRSPGPPARIGIPGLYVTEDPGAKDEGGQARAISACASASAGRSRMRFTTGQTPVLTYNRQLMQAILNDRLPIAKIVNATVIPLDQAPEGYQEFDAGVAKKFVLDPHHMVA